MRAHHGFCLLVALAVGACDAPGESAASSEEAIIGGREVTRAAFPATVALTTFDAGKLVCTATRIGPKAYLTAAHCLVDPVTGQRKATFANGAIVTMNTGDVLTRHFDDLHDVEVTGVAVAPAREIDVGVLFVEHSGDSHRVIKTAKIASAVADRVTPGRPVVLQGYGCASLAADDGKRRLRTATVIAGDAGIFERYQGAGMVKAFDTDIPIDVAAATPSATICFGDSGGGAYAPTALENDPHLRVIGVASSIDAPGLAQGDPTIRFARLARVDDGGRFSVGTWLEATLKAGRPQPLFDTALDGAVLLHATATLDAPSGTFFFPLADGPASRLAVEWEEPSCALVTRAARLVKGDRSTALVRGDDGAYAPAGAPAGPYDGIEVDLDFPSFDRIDNEWAKCTLRVRSL